MGFSDYPDIFFISLWTDKVSYLKYKFRCLGRHQATYSHLPVRPETLASPSDSAMNFSRPESEFHSPHMSALRSPTGFTVLNDSMLLRIYAELVRSLIWLWGPNSGMKVFALIRIHRKKQQRALHEAPYSDGIRHASSTHSSTRSSYL